jgi:hypothetical protein
MGRFTGSILAAAAIAVVQGLDSDPVTVYTLNSNGGTDLTDGIYFSLGWNDYAMWAADIQLAYTQDNALGDIANDAWGGSGMAMYIGDSGEGMSVLQEYFTSDGLTLPYMSWTSAITTGEDAESGVLTELLTAHYNDRDYTILTTYTYTFPNNYILFDYEFTIPVGHEAGHDVIAYYLSDTPDASTPLGGFADAETGAIGVTYDGASTQLASEFFFGFQYVCGDVSPHNSVGRYYNDGINTDATEGFITGQEFLDEVGTEGRDTGIHLSFNLGSTPGTYKARLALVIGELPNLSCDPKEDPVPRPYAQIVALWIGTLPHNSNSFQNECLILKLGYNCRVCFVSGCFVLRPHSPCLDPLVRLRSPAYLACIERCHHRIGESIHERCKSAAMT